MTSELTTRHEANKAYLARYSAGPQDPYAAFASEGGPGIVGKLLTYKKTEWTVGQDADHVKEGTRFLALLPSMMRGKVRWHGGTITDACMGYVKDNFPVPHRQTLGDLDEAQWEKDPAGNPKDPWADNYRLLLIEMSPPHGDITFSGSSFGASLALKDPCRAYSLDAHRFPDSMPVVELTTKTRQHKAYGAIKGPWFTIVGWASVEDVRSGKKNAVKTNAPPPTAEATRAGLNDALPY